MKKQKFYKEINVWKPISDSQTLLYRCIEVLPDNKFFVKACDSFYSDSSKKDWQSLESYHLENLFFGIFEFHARNASDSIEEAIAKHNLEFDISLPE